MLTSMHCSEFRRSGLVGKGRQHVQNRRWRVAVCCAWVLSLALLTTLFSTLATAADAGPGGTSEAPGDEQPLRVLVAGSEPFVSGAQQQPTGLSVDVFKAAAALAGLQYDISHRTTVAEALEAVQAGEADVAVGPISITARRAASVLFTQPYYQSNLAIMAPASDSLLEKLKPFLTKAFFGGVSALLAVLLLVGTIVWSAERKRNPDNFPSSAVAGIGSGVWMALVTMTTVGYGDYVPRTLAGRIVTGVWMLLSMIVASSMTAFIATALTLSQISGPQLSTVTDLKGRQVAVIAGTTGERLASKHGARIHSVYTLDDAVSLVQSNEAAAIVFDRPTLRYYLTQHPSVALQLS